MKKINRSECPALAGLAGRDTPAGFPKETPLPRPSSIVQGRRPYPSSTSHRPSSPVAIAAPSSRSSTPLAVLIRR